MFDDYWFWVRRKNNNKLRTVSEYFVFINYRFRHSYQFMSLVYGVEKRREVLKWHILKVLRLVDSAISVLDGLFVLW